MIELLGKTAFVTGASEGVGLEIAKAFFDRGAKVYLASKNSEMLTNVCNEMDTSLTRAIPVPLDVCSNTAINEVFDRFNADDVSFDILVNAATVTPIVSIQDINYDVWQQAMDTNLTGAFFITQHCLKRMKEKCTGKIINVISCFAKDAFMNTCAVAASKAGIAMLTKCIAVEYSKYNIKANVITTGFIDTPAFKVLKENQTMNDKILSSTPLGRWGNVNDVAQIAVFLASDKADYITGSEIKVDGGLLSKLL